MTQVELVRQSLIQKLRPMNLRNVSPETMDMAAQFVLAILDSTIPQLATSNPAAWRQLAECFGKVETSEAGECVIYTEQ